MITDSTHTVCSNIELRRSTHAYLDYRKRLQDRLANLNNTVSSMIKESFSGIDDICHRVRECLYTVHVNERQKTVNFALTMEEKIMDGSPKSVTEFEILDESPKSECDDMHVNDEATDTSIIENIDIEDLHLEQTPCTTSIVPCITMVCNDQGDTISTGVCEKIATAGKITEIENHIGEIETIQEQRFPLENLKDTVLRNVISTSYDDFDVMSKIIENISGEIESFSQEATGTNHQVVDKNKMAIVKCPELNTRLKRTLRTPQLRRPVTCYARARVTTLEQNISENELDSIIYPKKSVDPSLIPDVYRKRAFTDLYQRLLAQLEAQDSLMFFQKLMKMEKIRNKKTQKAFYNPNSKLLDIPRMNYFPNKTKSNPSSQEVTGKQDLSKKYTNSLWFSHLKNQKKSSRAMVRRKSKRKTESQRSLRTPINFSTKGVNRNRRTKQPASRKSSKVSSITIGDEKKKCPTDCKWKMTVHNDRPLSPSTKCRLHWMRAKTSIAPARKLEFLDILDDLTNRDLLPLQSEYPRRDHQQTFETEEKDIHSTYLYKLMYGKQSTKNAWKQLLEPSIVCNEKGCKTCSRPVSAVLKENASDKSTSNKEKPSTPKYTRQEILKKLYPYIHDPESKEKYYQSVTVMPVQVYYDNNKFCESPTKLKNTKTVSLSPKKTTTKEIKGFKRGEWSPAGVTKPMKVVFDSLPKVNVPSLPLLPNKQTSTSARITVENSIVQNSTSSSRSFSPKYTFTRSSLPHYQRQPIHVEIKQNTKKLDKINRDLDKIKEDIQGKDMSTFERKIWANKYGKSVGQQLVSFIEHQEPVPPPSIPKHANVKYKNINEPQNGVPVSANPKDGNSKDPNTYKSVLLNLQGLKHKNSAVQSNIQNAINVIEAKMVDILSPDGQTTNTEAFDVMEKEITSVLSMMKTDKKKTLKQTNLKVSSIKDEANTETSIEEEFNNISDELFKKLEKILDSERSSTSITQSMGRNNTSTASRSKKLTPKKVDSKQTPNRENKLSPQKEDSKPSPKLKKEENKLPSRKEETKSSPKRDELKKPKPLIPKKIREIKPQSLPLLNSAVNDGSIEISAPAKLNSPVNPNKLKEKPKGKIEKKSKLSTPTSRSIDQPLTNNWGNNSALPSGDQNTDTNKSPKMEKSQGDGSLETDKDISNNLDMTEEFKEVDGVRKPSKKVRFEEFLNDSIIHTNNYDIVSDDEHIMSPLDITSTEDEISNYGTPAQSPKSSRKHKQMANQQSNTSFAEQVNKIIKRVEDIYSQLDDMQNTSSEENVQKPKQKEEVKVFKEDDKKFKENVIKSDAYLTPFMQAVKEKRRAPEKNIQQSPSYYNVINFLDSLKDIQNETPIEVHTARLCYHVNVYHQPMVFDQAKMEHTTELLPAIESSKPEILRITSNGGCQKKTEGATKSKQKKVSFLVSKEDKSSQATVCAYHRKKLLRISSQQFPPSEKDTEQQTSRPPSQNESKMEQSTSFDNNILHQNCNNFVTPDSTDTAKNLPTEINNLDIPTTISPNLPSVEENIHENKGDENKIEKQISSVSSEQPILSNEQLLSKEDNETKNSSSEQSDNAVQVYCHVLEDGKSKTEEIVKPSTTSGNESTLKEDKNVGSCENRSYLPLSKKDRSNQAIFLTHKDICTDESINVNIDVCTEKGINTDQMESSQSTEVEYSNENSAISLFADSGRLGPKVVKECIDLRDGNYGPESVLHVKNSLQKLNQPKIVIFREVSKVANLLKPLQDLNSTRLLKKRPNGTELKLVKRPIINLIQTHGIKEIKTWGENVVLLKSFYAIVYILMFTALSLEYRCM